MLKVVCDTNTLVSAFLFRGNERRLMERLLDRKAALFTSQPLIDELSRVLAYPKLDVAAEDRLGLIDLLLELAAVVRPTETLDAITSDESDNRMLECAVESGADCIVTGDAHLLKLGSFRGIKIVRTKRFLEMLDAAFTSSK